MATEERIDLAHSASFRLGRLEVRPGTREVVRDDGERDVLEPRVMQVLVALARAQGGVVSRDDLTQSCWDGRVVGEDAINRVMSRLRRVAEGIGRDSFRIETVTKVGYRLLRDVEDERAVEEPPAPPAEPVGSEAKPISRRTLITAVGVAAVGAGGWAASRLAHTPRYPAPAPSEEAAMLMRQGFIAARSGTSEAMNQSVGFFRRVTELHPSFADGWGALAMTYAWAAFSSPPGERELRRSRARNAIQRARALDPGNPFAMAAVCQMTPVRGYWLDHERLLTLTLQRAPRAEPLRTLLSSVYSAVGRNREAADVHLSIDFGDTPAPVPLYRRALVLWYADRIEEADRSIEDTYQLYPQQYGVWFTRFYILLYTGRTAQAIAMAEDVDGRPPNIPDQNFADILQVAKARQQPTPAAIDAAVARQLEVAKTGAGHAENAMALCSFLGRTDPAFAIAYAYYFGRGFHVPSQRFPGQQRFFVRPADRFTTVLFQPSMANVRQDPRFKALAGELKLTEYWRRSGHPPDDRGALA
jgi:DNA-binding winged helix-turn-helix (wHTH) protein/tetratricopeptide (TPR) repeat protein